MSWQFLFITSVSRMWILHGEENYMKEESEEEEVKEEDSKWKKERRK